MSAPLRKTTDWVRALNADPLPWLLDPSTPDVRHQTLRLLLDRPDNDQEVTESLAAAMSADPIRSILEAQNEEGFWVKPGPGYSPKYRSTVWQLIFLDQLGADGSHPQVRKACEYILTHTQSSNGGFSCSSSNSPKPPPPSTQYHCLNGNLLRALLGFGYLDDDRVQRAITWQARSITGENFSDYTASGTTGPGFRCSVNDQLPCAWGAIRAISALARIPPHRRTPEITDAINVGVDILLGHDLVAADYPMSPGESKPSPNWFKLGFPSGYTADILHNLDLLCELGLAADPRLSSAIDWLLAKQDANGRWNNDKSYSSQTWTPLERQRHPSKWVTLRACRVLKCVHESPPAG